MLIFYVVKSNISTMETKLIQDKNQWNSWLIANNSSFTQSWEWGEILLSEGKRVERLAVVDGGEVLAQAHVIYTNIPFGWRYAFCPKGPVESSKFKVQSYKVYEQLAKYFKNKNCIFLRVEPASIIHDSKFIIQKTIDINPPATLILDLRKTEAELLAGMHQKTRYNINLAQKKGIRVEEKKDVEVFWSLMNETGRRDNFKLHDRGHYEKVLASPLTKQLIAYFENKPIACCVFAGFGDTFTYLYGASSYESRNLMAPYMLQWEGAKTGKRLGYKKYDFFGVAPKINDGAEYEYDPKHQYAGVTRFKLGFGGKPYQAPGTLDIVIDNTKYKLYNLLRKLSRFRLWRRNRGCAILPKAKSARQ